MVGDTILIKDISINGNSNLDTASELSETLTNNTINALGIDASSRTIWVNGQPYGNAYVNVNGDTVEAPIGAKIIKDYGHNTAAGAYPHAECSPLRQQQRLLFSHGCFFHSPLFCRRRNYIEYRP